MINSSGTDAAQPGWLCVRPQDRMQATARRHQPTFTQFVNRRIGAGGQGEQLFNLLVRPFAAPTFIGFWRLWNPVYGYYLYYRAYRPLRQYLPRPVAELATFAASGFFLHELPLFAARREVGVPYLTLWFVLAGGIAIAAEALHVDFGRLPMGGRIAVNIGYLLATLSAVVALTVAAR